MADLAPVAASVVAYSNVTPKRATAGATLTAGQAIYKDAADSNKAKLADDNDTAAKAVCVGVTLNGAASGQPVSYADAGDIDLGCTLAVGEFYILSDTAGAMCPIADATSGDRLFVVGYAVATNKLRLLMTNTETQKA